MRRYTPLVLIVTFIAFYFLFNLYTLQAQEPVYTINSPVIKAADPVLTLALCPVTLTVQ